MDALKEGCVERCPGCSHRSRTLQESLAQKEGWLKKQLGEWKRHDGTDPFEEEDGRWGYRRKILLTACCENNRWNFGMIRRDEFIAIPDCPVHTEATRKLIRLLIGIMPPSGVISPGFSGSVRGAGYPGAEDKAETTRGLADRGCRS